MEITKIVPSGYCKGVILSLQKVLQTVENTKLPQPIYIMGMIVHNRYVVEALNRLGVITLANQKSSKSACLDSIKIGTVIFTAHGTDPKLIQKAKDKGLFVVDATCPDVQHNMDLISQRLAEGYQIVYLGVTNHPEAEAVLSLSPNIHLITGLNDIDNLNLRSGPLMITNQTTMSVSDINTWIEKLKQRYPLAEVNEEICPATRLRQNAVKELNGFEALVVVGDPVSNNTRKLCYQGQLIKIPLVISVEDASQLDQYPALKQCQKIAVTAGASTPSQLTDRVISYLKTGDKKYQTVDLNLLLNDLNTKG